MAVRTGGFPACRKPAVHEFPPGALVERTSKCRRTPRCSPGIDGNELLLGLKAQSMLIIGNGGHAKVVREAVRALGNEYRGVFIAVGDNDSRKHEAEARPRDLFPVLIHPAASVAAGACIEGGTLICAGAVIDPAVTIGKHVIVNAGAVITHDCVIGDYAHIAPGVHLCGGVKVGEGALIGVGSCAIPGAEVPAWSVVPAGSVIRGLWTPTK